MGIATKSTFIFLAKLAGLLGSTAISIVLARLLGPEGKGELVAIFLIPMFMNQFLTFYMSGSVTYWLAKGRHDQKTILGTALGFMLFASVLATVIYLLVVFFADPEIFEGIDRLNLTLAGLTVPLVLVGSILSGALLSKEIIAPGNIIAVGKPIITLMLLISLCLIGDNYLEFAIASRLFAAVAGSAFLLYSTSRFFKICLTFKFRVFWDLIRYGIFGHLSMILGYIVYRVDMFFILAMTGKAQLGLYSISVMMGEALWMAPAALAQIIFPRVASTSTHAGAQAAAKGCRHSLLLAGVGSILFVIAGKWIIVGFFGRDFEAAYVPLLLLLPGICLNATGKSLAAYLAGSGRIRLLLGMSVVACTSNILFNIVLIPRYGICGAATATSLSHFFGWTLSTFAFLRSTGLKFWKVFIPTYADCAEYKILFRKGKNALTAFWFGITARFRRR